MGFSYYIVLENADPGFDATAKGQSIALEADNINEIARELSLPTLDDMVSMEADGLSGGILDDPNNEAEGAQDKEDIQDVSSNWRDPAEGLDWAVQIRDYCQENPTRLSNPKGVLKDLEKYIKVLEKAKEIGSGFYFSIEM